MPVSTQTEIRRFHRTTCAEVRNLADQFGRPGIQGKRGQTNKRIRRKGYVRIVWPTREMAMRFQRLVLRRLGLRSNRFKI